MSVEVLKLKQINEAEDSAEQLRAAAVREAAKIISDAEVLAAANMERFVSDGEKEGAEIRKRALDGAVPEVKKILDEAGARCEKLKADIKSKMPKAVDTVVSFINSN